MSNHSKLSELERGLLVGLFIGEAHFGGDGSRPQIVLRMHVRHEALFRWLQVLFPRCELYGPYRHQGRHYYHWMARGAPLAQDVLPIVEDLLNSGFEPYVLSRIRLMRERYAHVFSKYATR